MKKEFRLNLVSVGHIFSNKLDQSLAGLATVVAALSAAQVAAYVVEERIIAPGVHGLPWAESCEDCVFTHMSPSLCRDGHVRDFKVETYHISGHLMHRAAAHAYVMEGLGCTHIQADEYLACLEVYKA